MAKVALVKCDAYADAPAAVAKALDLIGGVDKVLSKDEKLLLKPNFLAKCPPEKACTTHPEVFRGVAKYLLEKGYKNLYYGDSPGHGDTAAIARECGVGAVADEHGRAEEHVRLCVRLKPGCFTCKISKCNVLCKDACRP